MTTTDDPFDLINNNDQGIRILLSIADDVDKLADLGPTLDHADLIEALRKSSEVMRSTGEYMQKVQPTLIEHGRLHGIAEAAAWTEEFNPVTAASMRRELLPGNGEA